jgi:PAS domain S-box-containing protein
MSMFSLRNIPMKRKLMLVIVLTSSSVLFLACAGFVAYDAIAIRQHMLQELSAEAATLGDRSRDALRQQDHKSLEGMLSVLRQDLDITCAAVYSTDGKLFASYQRNKGAAVPAAPPIESHRFDSGILGLSRPIRDGQKFIGTIYLESSLGGLYEVLSQHVTIAVSVLLVATLFAVMLSAYLQRLVSDPFLKLTQIAHEVIQKKDYSVRASKRGQDEAGQLIDAFNVMLTQIQERDKALRTANDELEKRVQERTKIMQQELVERMRTEEQLWESQRTLSTLMSNLPGAAYRCRNDKARTIEFISQGCIELTGFQPNDLIQNGRSSFAQLIHPDEQQTVLEEVEIALKRKCPFQLVYRILTANQKEKWVWEQGMGVFSPEGDLVAIEGFVTDITERRNAEEERKRVEEQLRQVQKMEAVGRLAGGVAHDFNNILTVITGYCDLLLRRTVESDPLHKNVDEISKAADRASSLTRQLLAFSRKQVLQPKVLELSDVVSGMEKMLRRLIGEDIELRTHFAKPLGQVKTDPGQIEQVIMNLAVNARDAMPQGGRLTIETVNLTLDQTTSFRNNELQPGEYVMLAVSDTGVGMTEAVREHLFEPFFTTKGPGKGTGLGLATCYGIIKQSGGGIRVYSEPNQGTTFKIYLPRVDEAPVPKGSEGSDQNLPQGKETLLMVEDESAVRELAALVLRECGYTVLEASNGQEGLLVAEMHNRIKIDLIISDIIMPQMGGREMVDRLQVTHPTAKVLYTSGYTDDALMDQGVLYAGVAFLEKPFSPTRLAQKVRAVLDEISLSA